MMRVLPGNFKTNRSTRVYVPSESIYNEEITVMEHLMPTLANAFYPYNMSLEDELKRLFANFDIKSCKWPAKPSAEEVMDEFRRNGKDFEYCPELESGEVPVTNSRRKKPKRPMPTECVFCKNNGEQESYYKGHLLKDINGKTRCPVLRAYTCPICGARGDDSHTLKYCPQNKNGEVMPTFNTTKPMRNSTGKRRYSK